jgi:hypothetical protein
LCLQTCNDFFFSAFLDIRSLFCFFLFTFLVFRSPLLSHSLLFPSTFLHTT